MRILWSPNAIASVEEVLAHIAEERPKEAPRLLNLIESKVMTLRFHPYKGAVIPGVEDDAKRVLKLNRNYSVVYEIRGAWLEILLFREQLNGAEL